MSDFRSAAADRVRALKSDFDRSFSDPHRRDDRDFEGYIAVRAGGDAYALRLKDVAALAARPRLAALPSRCPEFLGMAGYRGGLSALFSLPQLLGYGAGAPARWFVLTRAASLGLAFETYEGYFRAASSEVHAVADAAGRPFAGRAVRQAELVRLVVDVPAIVQALQRDKQEN